MVVNNQGEFYLLKKHNLKILNPFGSKKLSVKSYEIWGFFGYGNVSMSKPSFRVMSYLFTSNATRLYRDGRMDEVLFETHNTMFFGTISKTTFHFYLIGFASSTRFI